MKIKYLLIKHDINEKHDNEISPIYGIKITDLLEWIKIEDLANIKQFEQNKKFMPCLFKNELFEGKFLLGEQCEVLDYKIRIM